MHLVWRFCCIEEYGGYLVGDLKVYGWVHLILFFGMLSSVSLFVCYLFWTISCLCLRYWLFLFFRVIDGNVWGIFVGVFIVVIFTLKVYLLQILKFIQVSRLSGSRILLFGLICRFGIILREKLEGRLWHWDLFSFRGGWRGRAWANLSWRCRIGIFYLRLGSSGAHLLFWQFTVKLTSLTSELSFYRFLLQ